MRCPRQLAERKDPGLNLGVRVRRLAEEEEPRSPGERPTCTQGTREPGLVLKVAGTHTQLLVLPWGDHGAWTKAAVFREQWGTKAENGRRGSANRQL